MPSSRKNLAGKAAANFAEDFGSKSRENSIPLLSYLEEKNLVTLLSPVPNLKEHLFEYDLVVTHYGLTAYEAKSCGCHVLLLAPSKLHEKLSLNFYYHS